jgi:hypothetical protein
MTQPSPWIRSPSGQGPGHQPRNRRTAPKPVTKLHINQDELLADVTILDEETGKTAVLKTTQNHPFWNADADRGDNASESWLREFDRWPMRRHRLIIYDWI